MEGPGKDVGAVLSTHKGLLANPNMLYSWWKLGPLSLGYPQANLNHSVWLLEAKRLFLAQGLFLVQMARVLNWNKGLLLACSTIDSPHDEWASASIFPQMPNSSNSTLLVLLNILVCYVNPIEENHCCPLSWRRHHFLPHRSSPAHLACLPQAFATYCPQVCTNARDSHVPSCGCSRSSLQH